MTAAAFAAWVAHMKATRGWTAAECCKRLGSGNNQVRRWKISGAPFYIALACAALSQELGPWVESTGA
jgi:hypothetical protein